MIYDGSWRCVMELEEFLKVQEELLAAQLRVIRGHRRASDEKRLPAKGESKSQMSIVMDILSDGPLHISEIIRQAKERYGVVLDRESIVSALTKKVKKGVAFVRTGPNTFAVKGR
jgi:hypothetical protein